MLKFLTDFFDDQKKTLNKYNKIVAAINELEPKIKALSDTKLAAQTKKFKAIISDAKNAGQTEESILSEILPEAFATVREASRRVLGMRHYDVQLLAGIALHYGTITEQKTGEGKTLTVTAPLYLNALVGKGAHLITVNDYLAELGAGWMGPVYHFLGLSTAVIIHDQSKMINPEIDSEERGDERLEHFAKITRKEAYAADITYGTNNEFGFDYLRDNMVQGLEKMVQRTRHAHHYTIVDEADSILIDEARTPLIISAPDTEPTQKYYEFARMVTSLVKDSDYSVDEKGRTATLTDLGVKRIEKKLNVDNLYEENFDTIHQIETALKAKTLFTRDKDYIVRENQVIIVDEHTGRLMYGRRYSDGLHQTIEAKENVPIQQESRTLATISIQNYFRLYTKLSGMTGTAVTEAEEFGKIYNLEVLAIPTHRDVQRKDLPDIIYKTQTGKYSALIKEVEQRHKTGQPILIGTKSIENNQIISNFLKRNSIPHQVLNAKNNEKEAFIIADAGKKDAITVATNIAGRGVDIVLGGAKPEIKDFRKASLKATAKPTKEEETLGKALGLPPSMNAAHYKLKDYQKALEVWKKNHDEVIKHGGLHILGTERHESRRIDNQLRGRSGRQGDPGSSQFFVSLEDDLMRIFGGEQISKVMDMLRIDENQPIEHGMISKSLESAQIKVEGFFFDQRKRLVEFDDVMNKQRDIIYQRRRDLLEKASPESQPKETKSTVEELPLGSLKEEILLYIEEEIASLVSIHAPISYETSEFETIVKEFTKLIPFDQNSQNELVKAISTLTTTEEITAKLFDVAQNTYEAKEKSVGSDSMRTIERVVSLSTIDEKWMDHLDAMDSLREGIWLRGDKKTVLSEYKREAFVMFESLIASIETTVVHRIYRVQLQGAQQMNTKPIQIITQKEEVHGSIAQEVAQVQEQTSPAEVKPTSTKANLSDLAQALSSAKTSKAQPAPMAREKIGRNDFCPCGSGLKYKKCGLINSAAHRS